MTVTLIIARHGNTFEPDQTPTRVGARTDLPLVSKGREQAAALGRYLKQHNLIPDEVYCSHLIRTRQTAQIALEHMGLEREITALDIFNEIDYGIDENQTDETVIARIGKAALQDWEENSIPPAGWLVDTQAIKENIKVFANKITKPESDNHKVVLVLTSNGIARFTPTLCPNSPNTPKGSKLKLGTGCLSILEFSGATWNVKCWNEKPA